MVKQILPVFFLSLTLILAACGGKPATATPVDVIPEDLPPSEATQVLLV